MWGRVHDDARLNARWLHARMAWAHTGCAWQPALELRAQHAAGRSATDCVACATLEAGIEQ